MLSRPSCILTLPKQHWLLSYCIIGVLYATQYLMCRSDDPCQAHLRRMSPAAHRARKLRADGTLRYLPVPIISRSFC